MSTKYKISAEVPTAALAKRLDELAEVVGQPGEERDRELTRRIPAELDRDADLVLCEAAQRLVKLETERDALAAHVELFKAKAAELKERYPLSPWIKQHYDYFVKSAPDTSLARLKAQWQAEVLDKVTADMRAKGKALATIEALEAIATKRRQQAEGGEA